MPALRCRRCKPLHAPCMCVAARQMLPQTLANRYAALGHRRIALRSALGAAAPKATRLPATGLGGSRSTARPARMNAENTFPRVHRWPVAHKHVAASNQSLAADSRATEGAACLAPAPGRYVFSFPCATSLPHVPPADAAQQSRNPCAPAGAPRTHPPPETHTRSLKSHSLKSCGTGRPERRPPAHASPAADHPLRPSVLPAVCCGSDRFHHAAAAANFCGVRAASRQPLPRQPGRRPPNRPLLRRARRRRRRENLPTQACAWVPRRACALARGGRTAAAPPPPEGPPTICPRTSGGSAAFTMACRIRARAAHSIRCPSGEGVSGCEVPSQDSTNRGRNAGRQECVWNGSHRPDVLFNCRQTPQDIHARCEESSKHPKADQGSQGRRMTAERTAPTLSSPPV